MIWKLASALLFIAFCVGFAWPWVNPYITRHDVRERLLDRLEEEWDREGDTVPKDWNW